ncbi:hypothetical protein QMK19_24780 [Streptomyces sp. H10-C2]|uniref:hypothetical protein n=1 Tax=unclassified Streptomyces TaxID=2593676 RepID=UPI0024BB2AF7|nr:MULTISPECIES: hypothetical protein [unclassified Streptomyces]MDJ0343034.1 hypothetical protein [Streptomyces sp. PH10-H1]MDJ0372786.1 hypothetical protein [Streptomyces sp. H10-C2]
MALLVGLVACGPSRAGSQPTAGSQAAAQICISGTLMYEHRDVEAGENQPI